MTSTDPISDMLTRIRNAIAVNKHELSLPHSKVKENMAQLLKASGFIDDVQVESADGRKSLKLAISSEGSNARITEISRLSRPGKRLYSSSDKIPVVKRGRGLVIVSTSKGLMTGDQARSQHVGGELICEVY